MSELDKNPFTQPRSLDGSPIDLTHGRGFADDPTRVPGAMGIGGTYRAPVPGVEVVPDEGPLTRRAKMVAARLEKHIKNADKFAETNYNFNRVNLTDDEFVDAYEGLGPKDFERIAGIHSPADVRQMQNEYRFIKARSMSGPPEEMEGL